MNPMLLANLGWALRKGSSAHRCSFWMNKPLKVQHTMWHNFVCSWLRNTIWLWSLPSWKGTLPTEEPCGIQPWSFLALVLCWGRAGRITSPGWETSMRWVVGWPGQGGMGTPPTSAGLMLWGRGGQENIPKTGNGGQSFPLHWEGVVCGEELLA